MCAIVYAFDGKKVRSLIGGWICLIKLRPRNFEK